MLDVKATRVLDNSGFNINGFKLSPSLFVFAVGYINRVRLEETSDKLTGVVTEDGAIPGTLINSGTRVGILPTMFFYRTIIFRQDEIHCHQKVQQWCCLHKHFYLMHRAQDPHISQQTTRAK